MGYWHGHLTQQQASASTGIGAEHGHSPQQEQGPTASQPHLRGYKATSITLRGLSDNFAINSKIKARIGYKLITTNPHTTAENIMKTPLTQNNLLIHLTMATFTIIANLLTYIL